jgi:N6-L-threonylcarbamoyladenine synthase
VALVEDGRRVRANLVHSQQGDHAPYGGVVPELAARAHLERLPGLVRSALAGEGLRGQDVDRVAVTRGPGLVGCLLVGVGLAQGLAAAWGRPVRGVNHLWGHVYASLLTRPDLAPPLLALVVSGAHSDLVRMRAHGEFEVVGRTRDDAPARSAWAIPADRRWTARPGAGTGGGSRCPCRRCRGWSTASAV